MDVASLRDQKDEVFRRGHDSPLTPQQQRGFSGLRYFADDPAYRFEVTLAASAAGGQDEVEMSDGSSSSLLRAGQVSFRVGDREARLLAYEQGRELFIPFRDATSGKETYGAGRYVEAVPLEGGRYLLDFNRAYNPYCAYNENWRCPLPPRENWLDVAIRAGERSFHD